MFRFATVCSGIEAATQAWAPLGWEAAFYSEIAKFPRAVLEHRHPETPLLGDFTAIKGERREYGTIDLLAGGTPCQSFSVAGMRGGMDDARGNLSLRFADLARGIGARWIVWENVPGVLSSGRGRDFGRFLGALAECGYGFAYRVLDAQYFGVPQRRRRVVLVGYFGDWRPCAAVLFERDCLPGHREEGGPAGKEAPAGIAKCLTARGAGGGTRDSENANFIPYAVQGFNAQQDPCVTGRQAGALGAGSSQAQAVGIFLPKQRADAGSIGYSETTAPTLLAGRNTPALHVKKWPADIACTLNASFGAKQGIEDQHALGGASLFVPQNDRVRRLTPIECERLQGFPDDWTKIPYRGKPAEKCPDGLRYAAIGNSWCVPKFRWVGERIAFVDNLLKIAKQRRLI